MYNTMKKVSLLLAMVSIVCAISCKKDNAPAPPRS